MLLNLPTDILNTILSFIPLHYLIGKHGIKYTHKNLHPTFNANLSQKKTFTVTEIVSSCQSAEEALDILTDPHICARLSRIDMLTVASYHPQLADKLITQVRVHELPIIAKHHAAIALKIWRNRENLTSELRWGSLAKFHPKVAHIILNELVGCLENRIIQRELDRLFPLIAEELTDLGSIHLEIANRIRTTELLRSKVEGLMLGRVYYQFSLAKLLFDPEKLMAKPKNCLLFLRTVGLAHDFKEIAQDFFAIPNMVDHLDTEHVVTLAQKYRFVAEQVAEHPKLLASHSFPIAGMPEGVNGLVAIASAHDWLAAKILRDKKLLHSLTGCQLAVLTQNHTFIWQEIIKDKLLLAKFKPSDYAHAGCKKIEIASSILLLRPNILNELEWDDFEAFTQHNPALAHAILEKLQLENRYSVLELFFKAHEAVAMTILKTQKYLTYFLKITLSRFINSNTSYAVRNKLLTMPVIIKKATKTDLINLSSAYPYLQNLILRNEACLTKFIADKGGFLHSLRTDYENNSFALGTAKELQASVKPQWLNDVKPAVILPPVTSAPDTTKAKPSLTEKKIQKRSLS